MVTPFANSPRYASATVQKRDTKAATKDIIQVNEDLVPVEEMTDLIFEDIGGQEIISLSRHDTINGQNLTYSPISNILSVSRQYNSQNILPVQNSMGDTFSNYSIGFEKYTPEEKYSYDINGDIQYADGASLYIDQTSGGLVINVIDIGDDEQVEVQILTAGSAVDAIMDKI